MKPKLAKDKAEFQYLRTALYGPGVPNPQFAYQPAHLYIVKPNGDAELWKFTDIQTSLPNIEKKIFQYQPVPGFKAPKGRASLPEVKLPDLSGIRP